MYEHGGIHAFVTVGTRGMYLYHVALFVAPAHEYQIILEVELDNPRAQEAYFAFRRRHGESLCILGPGDPPDDPRFHWPLTEIASGQRTTIAGKFVREFDPSAPAIPGLEQVNVRIRRIIHFRKLDPHERYPDELTYVIFGSPDEVFLSHLISRAPSFQSVSKLAEPPAFLTPDALSRDLALSVPEMSISDAPPRRLNLASVTEDAHAFIFPPRQPHTPVDPLRGETTLQVRYGGRLETVRVGELIYYDVSTLNNMSSPPSPWYLVPNEVRRSRPAQGTQPMSTPVSSSASYGASYGTSSSTAVSAPTMPPAGAASAPQLSDLLSRFPPGVDPETYRIDEVTKLLDDSALFPIFSIHNPADRNTPIFKPWFPITPVAVDVNEQLHRFDIRMCETPAAFGASNTVGQPLARVHIRWTVIPWNFQAAPDRMPPPTPLNPFKSQRFTMLDGQFNFDDAAGSGFKGFGAGRTFPVRIDGERRLRIGAVVDILEGFGDLAGVQGAVVINGFIQPPQNLALNIMVRVFDPTGKFRTSSPLANIQPFPSPDPTATFLVFQGEIDPSRPVQLRRGPDGQIEGSDVFERLRLVSLDFDVNQGRIRSRAASGPLVGTVAARLSFNPLAPTTVSPIQTTNGVFSFHDLQGRGIGTVHANMVEGRAMRTELAGAPLPVFRFGGFGPLMSGTGHFSGIDGMMSMNSAISVFPRTLSNLYVFRVFDPDGKFKSACEALWT